MQSHLYEWSVKQSERLPEQKREIIQKWFDDNYKERHAILILMGQQKGFIFCFMAGILLFYNVFRLHLTLKVGELRDTEERSHVTPGLEEYYGKYNHIANSMKDKSFFKRQLLFFWGSVTAPNQWKWKGLYFLHQFTKRLMWIAIISLVGNSLYWIIFTKVRVAIP